MPRIIFLPPSQGYHNRLPIAFCFYLGRLWSNFAVWAWIFFSSFLVRDPVFKKQDLTRMRRPIWMVLKSSIIITVNRDNEKQQNWTNTHTKHHSHDELYVIRTHDSRLFWWEFERKAWMLQLVRIDMVVTRSDKNLRSPWIDSEGFPWCVHCLLVGTGLQRSHTTCSAPFKQTSVLPLSKRGEVLPNRRSGLHYLCKCTAARDCGW